jgi:hypothetical protein
MPFLNLAATPAVRFPDPSVKRVSPNGTQSLSAYNATCLYYDLREGAWLGDINPEAAGDLRPVEFLLFGTDYPALVTATSYYGENLGGNGSYFPTFNESEPVFGSYGVSEYNYLLANPSPIPRAGYKQIISGTTASSGISVQGFPHLVNLRNHGIAQGDPPTLDAPCVLALSVVMNAPVVASSTAFYKADIGTRPNLPVIIHEKDLTQEIVDAGFRIPAQTVDLSAVFGSALAPAQGCDLDVVGLWATNYDPLNP